MDDRGGADAAAVEEEEEEEEEDPAVAAVPESLIVAPLPGFVRLETFATLGSTELDPRLEALTSDDDYSSDDGSDYSDYYGEEGDEGDEEDGNTHAGRARDAVDDGKVGGEAEAGKPSDKVADDNGEALEISLSLSEGAVSAKAWQEELNDELLV